MNKCHLFLSAACCALASIVSGETTQEMRDRIIPYISNSSTKAEAMSVLDEYKQAETIKDSMIALSKLGKIDAAPAKVAALYYSFDPVTSESLQTFIKLELEDMPLLLSWLITNGLKTSELFGSTESFGSKCEQLGNLTAKINEVLSSSGAPGDSLPSPSRGPQNFTPDSLLGWSKGQIQWSLSNVSWNAQDRDYLNSLLASLDALSIPDEEHRAALIEIAPRKNAPAPASSPPMRPVAQVPPSPARAWAYAPHGAALLVALSMLAWWMMRKRKPS